MTSSYAAPRASGGPGWKDLAGLLMLIVLVLLVLLCTSCAGTSARAQGINTALNVMTDVIDPAYEAARLTCKASDDNLIALAEHGKIAIADMEEGVAASRARCDKTFSVFDQLITIQKAARAALEGATEQALNEAEEQLRHLREIWSAQ